MEYTTHVTLLARLSEGIDPSAWGEFQQRYGELIMGFARRYGLQEADCDDVAQDVLLALSQAMGEFEYDPARGKFRSFLKTLTTRAIFKKIRQKRSAARQWDSEANAPDGAADDHVEALWEAEWQRYHIRQAMARLAGEFNDKDRMAFAHYAIQGLSATDTAGALEISLDQVYQAKSRILKRLSQLIEEQVADEG